MDINFDMINCDNSDTEYRVGIILYFNYDDLAI